MSRLDAETFTDTRIIALAPKDLFPIKVNPEDTRTSHENEETPLEALSGVTAFPARSCLLESLTVVSLPDRLQDSSTPERVFTDGMEAALEKEQAFVEQLTKLEKTPDDAKLNAQVAVTYLERTQLEKALPFSKKAFEHDPKNKHRSYAKLAQPTRSHLRHKG